MGGMQVAEESWKQNEIFCHFFHSANLLLKQNVYALIINMKQWKNNFFFIMFLKLELYMEQLTF